MEGAEVWDWLGKVPLGASGVGDSQDKALLGVILNQLGCREWSPSKINPVVWGSRCAQGSPQP